VKTLFVDTAGWMMLADANDPQHARARKACDAWLESGGHLISTDFVMDETLTLIRTRLGLTSAERWWEHVAASRRLHWEWIDSDRAEKARHWFFGWKDKAFSFTDCTSFVVMRERRLKRALTSDGHFTQAGFEVVP
jgi:predicted nucleic acid-binding protein